MEENIPTNYNHKEVESRIRKFWEEEKIFFTDLKKLKKSKKIFLVDTPPPTVSGRMHMGHAFSYSQQDFIVRFKRMNMPVFYPFGTDDNGLPTERLIEKLKNVKSKKMDREEFIKLCLETLKEITPSFIEDWKKLGISCDFSKIYSTIDDHSRKISQKFFIELYKKGRIYEKEFPTLWCTTCETSIAQAELEDREEESFFTTIKFYVDKEILPIATTRPELLPACVAIFVHPQDNRYKKFVGKKAKVPLFGFEVPIIKDYSANPEKGTGALMICSYGDKYDVDAISRYKLEEKIVLNYNGILNEKAGKYTGLSVKEARKKILEDLEKEGLIIKKEKIKHVVNVHDKCGTEIEFLPTRQWFIKILDLKKKWIELGKKIKWYPEFMFKRYKNWINGLEWDWNISRDRHFGVPIPLWKCTKCGEIILAEEKELPVDPTKIEKRCYKCKSVANPEKKVLDTWATSSLTPQIASSLFDNEIKLPFSLRPQAHDIIRTWAFYTIIRSYFSENKIPWKEIMISGFVTLHGEKMSKSKGNVIDPQNLFEKYGADVLRYWAASSRLGEDFDYNEKDFISGKKFLIKLWNASRFIFMNLKEFRKDVKKLEVMDKWILFKLNNLVKEITESFENYQYHLVKNKIEKFFWNDFCDNYLEIVKRRIYEGTNEEKESAYYTLYKTIFTLIKLLAPIMPFITEEIYQKFLKACEEKSIHLCKWPKADKKNFKKEFEIGETFIQILHRVREEKSKAKKSLKSKIILKLEKEKLNKIKPALKDLKAVINAERIEEGNFEVIFI